jgi:hypothetical protein
MHRYSQAVLGIRRAFVTAGISVIQLDSSRSLGNTTQEMASLLTEEQ